MKVFDSNIAIGAGLLILLWLLISSIDLSMTPIMEEPSWFNIGNLLMHGGAVGKIIYYSLMAIMGLTVGRRMLIQMFNLKQ